MAGTHDEHDDRPIWRRVTYMGAWAGMAAGMLIGVAFGGAAYGETLFGLPQSAGAALGAFGGSIIGSGIGLVFDFAGLMLGSRLEDPFASGHGADAAVPHDADDDSH